MAERYSDTAGDRDTEDKVLQASEHSVSSSTAPERKHRGKTRCRSIPLIEDSESDISCDDSDKDPEFIVSKEHYIDSDDESPEKIKGIRKKQKKIIVKKVKGYAKTSVGSSKTSVGEGGGDGDGDAAVRPRPKLRKKVTEDEYEHYLFSDTEDDNGNGNGNNRPRPSPHKERGGLIVGAGEGIAGPSTSFAVIPSEARVSDSDSSDYDYDNVGAGKKKRVVVKKGRRSEVHKSDWARNVAKKNAI